MSEMSNEEMLDSLTEIMQMIRRNENVLTINKEIWFKFAPKTVLHSIYKEAKETPRNWEVVETPHTLLCQAVGAPKQDVFCFPNYMGDINEATKLMTYVLPPDTNAVVVSNFMDGQFGPTSVQGRYKTEDFLNTSGRTPSEAIVSFALRYKIQELMKESIPSMRMR